jgi:hypothetical protein
MLPDLRPHRQLEAVLARAAAHPGFAQRDGAPARVVWELAVADSLERVTWSPPGSSVADCDVVQIRLDCAALHRFVAGELPLLEAIASQQVSLTGQLRSLLRLPSQLALLARIYRASLHLPSVSLAQAYPHLSCPVGQEHVISDGLSDQMLLVCALVLSSDERSRTLALERLWRLYDEERSGLDIHGMTRLGGHLADFAAGTSVLNAAQDVGGDRRLLEAQPTAR